MARKTTPKTEPAITLTRQEAERLMELYTNVEAADAHFQRCQSDLFRQHVQGVYRAQTVEDAYRALRARLEEVE